MHIKFILKIMSDDLNIIALEYTLLSNAYNVHILTVSLEQQRAQFQLIVFLIILLCSAFDNNKQNHINMNSLLWTEKLNFCYMYIESLAQAWTCFPMCLLGTCILAYTVKQYRLHLKLNTLNDNVKLTYVSILVSLAFFIAKCVMAETVFWLQFNREYSEQDQDNYIQIAKIQFVLDCIGVFAMQTTILLVPANWFTNIVQIFSKLQSQHHYLVDQKNKNNTSGQFESRAIKVLTAYFVIRFILFLGIIIPFNFLTNQLILGTIAKILLIWCQVESLFILSILIMGLTSLFKNDVLKTILQENDYKLMIKNYIILVACLLLRLATDLSFTVMYFENQGTKEQCYIDTDGKGSVSQVVNLLLEGLLTFYLSIIIVLRIYKAQKIVQDDLQTLFNSSIPEQQPHQPTE